MYERKNQPPPVRALTGLWMLVPIAFGYLLMIIGFVGLVASSSTDPVTGRSTDPSTGSVVFVIAAVVVFLATSAAGSIVWFVKTNGALNRYWEQLPAAGLTAASAPAAPFPPAAP
jgi:hypothetical protein